MPVPPLTCATTTLLALLLGTLFVFSNLGLDPLSDWDEAWHARIALGIARHNTWLNYTDGGVLNTAAVKPPLYFWMMALAFKALGPSEFSARLFPALCYLALIGVVTSFCHRRLNWTIALTTAFLLSTHGLLVYQHGARSADIDAPLVLFLTVTMLGIWRLAHGGLTWWLPLAWTSALLTKGPAALQVVPVVVLWLAWRRAWPALPRALIVLASGMVPLATFLLIREHLQPGTAAALLTYDTVGRVAGTFDGGASGPLLYTARLVSASWPVLLGILITLVAARGRLALSAQRAAREESSKLLSFLLLWWLVPFALFTFIPTRRVWYVYPSLVPACVLAAWLLRAGLARLEAGGPCRTGGLVAILVLLGMGGPALRQSIWPSRTNRERAAEYVRLVHVADACDDNAPLIGFWLMPGERFYLDLAGIRMVETMCAGDVRQAVAECTLPVCVAYPSQQRTVVHEALQEYDCERILVLPRRAAELIRVSSR